MIVDSRVLQNVNDCFIFEKECSFVTNTLIIISIAAATFAAAWHIRKMEMPLPTPKLSPLSPLISPRTWTEKSPLREPRAPRIGFQQSSKISELVQNPLRLTRTDTSDRNPQSRTVSFRTLDQTRQPAPIMSLLSKGAFNIRTPLLDESV